MKTPDTKSIANEIEGVIQKSPAHGRFVQAQARLEQLRDDVCMKKQALQELLKAPPNRDDGISAAAEALLSGGTAAVAAVAPAAARDTEIQTAQREIAVLERAIDLQASATKDLNYRELSAAVRRLEAVALRDPVMPVVDGFFG